MDFGSIKLDVNKVATTALNKPGINIYDKNSKQGVMDLEGTMKGQKVTIHLEVDPNRSNPGPNGMFLTNGSITTANGKKVTLDTPEDYRRLALAIDEGTPGVRTQNTTPVWQDLATSKKGTSIFRGNNQPEYRFSSLDQKANSVEEQTEVLADPISLDEAQKKLDRISKYYHGGRGQS